MLRLIVAVLATIRVLFRSRVDIALQVLALRQQVAVLKRKRPRPVLASLDRAFWTALRHVWPRWSEVLASERWVGSCRREILDHVIARTNHSSAA